MPLTNVSHEEGWPSVLFAADGSEDRKKLPLNRAANTLSRGGVRWGELRDVDREEGREEREEASDIESNGQHRMIYLSA